MVIQVIRIQVLIHLFPSGPLMATNFVQQHVLTIPSYTSRVSFLYLPKAEFNWYSCDHKSLCDLTGSICDDHTYV